MTHWVVALEAAFSSKTMLVIKMKTERNTHTGGNLSVYVLLFTYLYYNYTDKNNVQ